MRWPGSCSRSRVPWYAVIVRGWWLCLAIAGCGDNLPPQDHAQSGSRLKLSWYELDDGTRTWANGASFYESYYDSELGVDCSPTTWADGTTYCTPTLSWIGYADAACTQRIGRDLGMTFAAELTWSCDSWHPARLFELGATKTLPRYYIRNSLGECFEGGGPGEVVEIGRPLSPNMLVEMSTRRIGNERIGIEMRTADDGLTMPIAPYDNKLATQCHVSSFDNVSDVTCVPEQLVIIAADEFGDPTCRDPVTTSATGCSAPTVAVSFADGSCPQYYRVGNELGMTLYAGPSCSRRMTPAQTSVRSIGDRVELAAMTRTPEAIPDRRVQLIYFEADGMRFRDPQGLYDSVLRSECVMVDRPDGSAVCVPAGYSYVRTFFADAACTSSFELIETYDGYERCLTREPFRFVSRGDSGVFEVGALHVGPVFEEMNTTCARVTRPLYDFGPSVPAASLPQAIRVRDL